jgi:hypothetical protein
MARQTLFSRDLFAADGLFRDPASCLAQGLLAEQYLS